MELSQQCSAAVILLGGHSRRMGCRKAELLIDGVSMLDRTRAALGGFEEVFLSVGEYTPEGCDAKCIRDVFPDCGPLAGIHAALSASGYDALFFVPCDLPNFTAELPRLMCAQLPPDADAFVCRDSTGWVHPLCGIYRRSILPQLEAALRAGRCSVMRFLETLNCSLFDTAPYLPDSVFLNMNSPDVYRSVCEQRK